MNKKKSENLLLIDVDGSCDDYTVTNSGTFKKGSFAINAQWKDVRIEDFDQTVLLGQGSSGVVYKAIHRKTGMMVALKDISVFDAQKRNQIVNELEALYTANCPYLVGFFGAFYNDGSISLALEIMEGGSLKDICQSMGKIPEPVLSIITEQVLQGLKYLHKERHMIHRDLKPSNILMNSEGFFKITDFGVSAELENTLEQCATFVGTVTYMSPERLIGEKYSFASDIWSLGITLIECATGAFPFVKDNGSKPVSGFWELLTHIKTKEPPELRVEDGYSAELCDFVKKCLNKSPKERCHVVDLLNHPFIVKFNKPEIKQAYKMWTNRVLLQQQKLMESKASSHSSKNHIENGLKSLKL